jgi:dephospho-CoA kinase
LGKWGNEAVRVVGITGGAGAGKTTLSHQLQAKGIPVLFADQIGREVVAKGTPVLRALVATFGRSILTPNEQLNRPKVGQWVFGHPLALRRLNQLTHPAMRSIIEARLRFLRGRGYPMAVVEAALLFEMGLRRSVDAVWGVIASERERLRRLVWQRQALPSPFTFKVRERWQDAWRRMRCQLSSQGFMQRAHRVMVTDRKPTVPLPLRGRRPMR